MAQLWKAFFRYPDSVIVAGSLKILKNITASCKQRKRKDDTDKKVEKRPEIASPPVTHNRKSSTGGFAKTPSAEPV